MVIITKAHVVLTLTFIMTENFPIPLRMLYHIPVKKTTGQWGENIISKTKMQRGQTDFLREHEPSGGILISWWVSLGEF